VVHLTPDGKARITKVFATQASLNYLAVRLRAGESWRYQPAIVATNVEAFTFRAFESGRPSRIRCDQRLEGPLACSRLNLLVARFGPPASLHLQNHLQSPSATVSQDHRHRPLGHPSASKILPEFARPYGSVRILGHVSLEV
jgi:hypothetical protein